MFMVDFINLAHNHLQASFYKMGKRDWSKYPGGILKAYNGGKSGAGIVIGGAILAIAAIPGFVFATPFFIVGGAIGSIGLLAGLWEAVPPEYREAANLVGKYEILENLKDIDPPLFKVGIIGLSGAGKTTLIRKFCRIPDSNLVQGKTKGKVTQKLYVYIAALTIPSGDDKRAKPKYLAFIDAPGEEEPNQLQVAEASDFLCVVVDHNNCCDNNNKDYLINPVRLEEHKKFVKNVSLYLKNKRRENPISCIHFLLNKRDIWENNNSVDEIVTLKEWFQEKVRDWKTAIFVKDNNLSNSYHSNESSDDFSKFEEILLNALKN